MAAQILDALPELVVQYRLSDHVIVYCNASWASGHHLTPEQAVGQPLDRFLSAGGRVGFDLQVARLGPTTPLLADPVPREDVTTAGKWVEWVDRYLPGDEVISVGRDVSDRHRAEQWLVESEARFRELAERSADMVFRVLVDPVPHFDYLSPSVEGLTGFPPSYFMEDFGRLGARLDDDGRALLDTVMAGVPGDRVDLRGLRRDGSAMITEVHFTAIPGGWQGIGSDVTVARGIQAEVAERAFSDALTGLANRHMLDEFLAAALAGSRRTDALLTALFLDLDGFKTINDDFGHDVGDAVLCAAARRMQSAVRASDVVARIGGDEFVIICQSDSSEPLNVTELVERLDALLAVPITVGPTLTVTCPASIGCADTRTTGPDAAALLGAADASMYVTKRARKAAALAHDPPRR